MIPQGRVRRSEFSIQREQSGAARIDHLDRERPGHSRLADQSMHPGASRSRRVGALDASTGAPS